MADNVKQQLITLSIQLRELERERHLKLLEVERLNMRIQQVEDTMNQLLA